MRTFIVAIALTARAASAADFVPLGFLHPNDPGRSSAAHDVSADGLVAVGSSQSSLAPKQAFRWTQQTGMTGLGFLVTNGPNAWSEARAASCDGSVIAGVAGTADGHMEAFRWTQQMGMQALGVLDRDNPGSQANAVSCDGSVVAGASVVGNLSIAFRWTAATGMVALGDLPGGNPFGHAAGMSYDGNVIVGASHSSGGVDEGFIWTALTGMVGLGDVSGIAFGSYISRASAVAGNSTSVQDALITGRASAEQAYRWSAASGVTGLGFNLPGPHAGKASYGLAISADGSHIAGRWTYELQQLNHYRAMLWDASFGMRDIKSSLQVVNTPGVDFWTLSNASGISANASVIVGNGENPNGEDEGWLVRNGPPPPEEIDWEATQSHIICCWQPPGPAPWQRVFDGSKSGVKKDCAPLTSYEWSFGDGGAGTGEIARHTYRNAGIYRAQLTVTDSCGVRATDAVNVLIR